MSQMGAAATTDYKALQDAARDAILHVEVPRFPPMTPALREICEVSRLAMDAGTSSIVVRHGQGWEVGAATGAGSEKITGLAVDPRGKSVTGYVINTRKPYFFSSISTLPELAGTENRSRGFGDSFCALPITDASGSLLGVLNIAGIDSSGNHHDQKKHAIQGILDAIAGKLAAIREKETLFSAGEDVASLKRADADKEKLLMMAVHDLKNSLTLIKANLYYLEQMNFGAEADKILGMIKFGGDRALDLVLSILDSRKLRDNKLQPCITEMDLAPFLVYIIKEFDTYSARMGVDVLFTGNVEIKIRADRSLIRRMVTNLLDNALKHSPLGGKVTLSAEARNGSVDIMVEDQGRGVPPDLREKIFNLYDEGSLQDSGSGSAYGIGLAFCKLAAMAHGGAIWVESGGSGGSRFVLRLPA
ncbi:MAG: HAMP domain-containing histidine kinase [Nitrospinota bacterium]|nr:HAMP domain-containing histidine kinase [Nitrospinota bacterium]